MRRAPPAPTITTSDGQFLADGKPFLLYSGEIHYFRLPARQWRGRLQQIKRLGLNAVGSYIPWRWHEIKEGQVDLVGATHPERNLVRYLELVREAGLQFFGRIGPISNAELSGEGLPGWLLEGHPEIRLQHHDGTPHSYPPLLSLHHPTFQACITRWYDALLPVLARFQAEAGGPLGLLQVENEISMLNWLATAPDYSATTTNRYREYLKDRYRTIERVNQAYGASYPSFVEVEQPSGRVMEPRLTRVLDWAGFYREHYAEYYARLVRRVRGHGLRVPLVANIPQFHDFNMCGRAYQGLMTTTMFREFAVKVPHTVFGGAYQMRRLDFENFHDAILMTEAMKMISTPGTPCLCAELQVGGMNDRPRIYGTDVALNLRLCIGHGMSGVNAYMLSGGVTPPGLGERGAYHEWQAPIASTGDERPHAARVREFGRWVAGMGELAAAARKVYDLALGVYPPYYMTEYLRGRVIETTVVQRDRLFFDGMARLLHLAGYQCALVDLQRAAPEDLAAWRHLWVFALDYMDRGTQATLLRYVRAGGALLLNPCVPVVNLDFERETTLLKGLGVEPVERIGAGIVLDRERLREMEEERAILSRQLGIRIVHQQGSPLIQIGRREVLIDEKVSVFARPRGGRVLATTPDGRVCGLLTRVAQGQVAVLGFGLTHLFDYHIAVAREIATALGVPRRIRVEPEDVHAVLREGAQGSFLTIENFNDEARQVAVTLRLPGERGVTRLPSRGTVGVPNRSGWIWPLGLDLGRGRRLRFATGEVVTVRADRGVELTVRAPAGGLVEVGLEGPPPRTVKLGGRRLERTQCRRVARGRVVVAVRPATEEHVISLSY